MASRRLSPILPFAALLVAMLGLAPAGGAHAAGPAKKPKRPGTTSFEVCRHGCRYATIQKGVDAAGSYARAHRGAEVKVAIRPGRYVEGVVLDGTDRRRDFDGLTIEGTSPDRRRTVLEGRGATGRLGAADGIEAIGVSGLTLKSLWARNFAADGFLVRAAPGGHCDGYTMDDLLASGNSSSGLAARGCSGGRMIESAAYRQGEAGFGVGETPCDSRGWSVYDSAPCQARPRTTLVKDDESYENVLGYAGPNAKYVLVLENAFFDDGTGVVADTLADEGYGPNGWNVIERNYVFWNNYDPYLLGSAVRPETGGLGELDGRRLNYPIGVGIVLYGADHDVVRGNRVFGNFKWGIASFSAPAETPLLVGGDEGRSVDNEIVENALGRGGADPNGEYDIWNDGTGGGNCWGANSANATFAPGNGKVPPGAIYPICPQDPIAYATARSVNLNAGLQTSLVEASNPATLLGYTGADPPQDQQCSWVRRAVPHPAFQRFAPAEVEPRPGELSCERG